MFIDVKEIKPLVLENIQNQGVVLLSNKKKFIKEFKKNFSKLSHKIKILDDETKGLHEILKNEDLYDIIITNFKNGYKIKRIMPHKKVLVVDYKENFDFKYIIVDEFVSKPVDKVIFYNAMYSLTKVIADEKELKYYLNSLETEISELNCNMCRTLNKNIDDINLLRKELFSLMHHNCEFQYNSSLCGIEEKIKEKEKIENDKYENHNMRFTLDEDKKIDAQTFVSELNDIDFERVDILKEHFGEFTIFLNNAYTMDYLEFYENKDYIVSMLNELYQSINRFYRFEILAITFKDFADFINNLTLEDLQKSDNKEMFLDSLIAIIDDVIDWIDIIFFLKTTDNINYLDASFSSNCEQIKEIFKNEEVLEDDMDDLEFF